VPRLGRLAHRELAGSTDLAGLLQQLLLVQASELLTDDRVLEHRFLLLS